VAPVELDRRVVYGAAAVLFALSLLLYVLTMAPGLTWENTGGDGGDFLAAAFTWGIPHPTGYPTYIVLLRLFGEAAPIGSEAARGNLFSAVCGALTAPVLFGATWRLLGVAGGGRRSKSRLAVCAFAVASFATANLFWSQATITEVYTLGALFAAALLWAAVEVLGAARNGSRRRGVLAAAAFLFGLALGNSVTIALFALPLAAIVLYETHRRFGWSAVLDWRPVAGLLAGLAIYVYAPIASAQDPPLNWFMPHTWSGFRAMVTGALYQDYLFNVRPGFVPSRILAALDLWLTQYSVPGAILGVAGLSILWERARWLSVASLTSALLLVVYAITYNSFDPYVYLVPAFMLFAAWMALGLASLLDGARPALQRMHGVPAMLRGHPASFVLLLAFLLVPVWSVAFNYRHIDISDDNAATRFVAESFDTAGPGSVIFAQDVRAFSLWYQEMVAEPDSGVAVVALHMLPYDWYWEQLQRRFPERMPSGAPAGSWTNRMAAVIAHNWDRKVFFTERGDYNEGWVLLEDGPLLAVAPRP